MKSVAILSLAFLASACGGSQGEPVTPEEHEAEAEKHEDMGTGRDKSGHQRMADEHHEAAEEAEEAEDAEEEEAAPEE